MTPMPLTRPGIPQLAESPFADTYKPPMTFMSTLPPLIMANDSLEPNKEEPA